MTPIRDEEGTLTGFSKVTRDITDRKKLLDDLQRHAQELETQIAERERTNAELEAFNGALVRIRDVAWALSRDRLRTAAAVAQLAGPRPSLAAVDAFWAVQVALSST